MSRCSEVFPQASSAVLMNGSAGVVCAKRQHLGSIRSIQFCDELPLTSGQLVVEVFTDWGACEDGDDCTSKNSNDCDRMSGNLMGRMNVALPLYVDTSYKSIGVKCLHPYPEPAKPRSRRLTLRL